MSIFKSYDVRGVYGQEWGGETAYRIGRHLPPLLNARRIAVGYDARRSSPEVFRELCRGLTESGCRVADIGMCDTPAVYFATVFYGLDGSVMITASHNPPEYNGLKISAREAVPVGGDSGLADLEARLATPLPPPSPHPGVIEALDIRTDYLAHLGRFRSELPGTRAVIDCSNGTAGVYLRDALASTGGSFSYLFDQPDGGFPNHAPNPLIEANLSALKARVVEEKADLGICFDGDADRVVFVDERGGFVSPDLVIALLGTYYFVRHPERLAGGTNAVTYDVRTSRGVVEALTSLGADPRICRVGHSYAKRLLRETRGIFGGELAGHYYFRENFFCDSAAMAALALLELLAQTRKRLSEMVAEVSRYYSSGEINFTVPNGGQIVERIRADHREGKLTDIDGIRVDYPDWWFNLRVSNTEPLLRLVVEATTPQGLQARRRELQEEITRYTRQ